MKPYDRAYFERWYHNPQTRVWQADELQRKAILVLSLAEYLLGRPVERVLDVGCGEGLWRAPLLQLRPEIDYLGLDPSGYAVQRYGQERNIHQMRFGQLAEQRFSAPFDLIVCANVLQYLSPAEIRRGLSGFVDLLDGMAFMETYVRGDDVVGDRDGFRQRNAGWYRQVLRDAGLVACGPQAWLPQDIAACLPALDLPA